MNDDEGDYQASKIDSAGGDWSTMGMLEKWVSIGQLWRWDIDPTVQRAVIAAEPGANPEIMDAARHPASFRSINIDLESTGPA